MLPIHEKEARNGPPICNQGFIMITPNMAMLFASLAFDIMPIENVSRANENVLIVEPPSHLRGTEHAYLWYYPMRMREVGLTIGFVFLSVICPVKISASVFLIATK